jgi:hypothetical protein
MTTRTNVDQFMDLSLGIHAAAYVAVVGGLAELNLQRTPENPWVLWVARGWGIGLAAHATTCRAMQAHESRIP